MKNKRNLLSSLIIMLTGVIYFPVHAQQKHGAEAVIYQLDVKKSKLFWKAPKNQHNGFILFNSGTLNHLTNGWPTRGAFNINMNTMRSTDEASADGRKKVDDELRSEDFFDVSKYPTATILISKIVPEPNSTTFRVYGALTIKGVTKQIEFTTIMKQNSDTIMATANMTISRTNWNINYKPDATSWNFLARVKDNLVDDEIPVTLELVFTRR